MKLTYPHLFSPLKAGRSVLKNRILTSPSNHALQGAEPYPTEAAIIYFGDKAKGGASVVHCGSVRVDPLLFKPDRPTHHHWVSYNLHDYHNLRYFRQQTDVIHFYGAKASIELLQMPGGGYEPSDASWRKLYAVNYCEIQTNPHTNEMLILEEMPEEEMDRIAEAFSTCAVNARTAGFDMVFVHGGHGFELAQFISPFYNKRTDKYGGSIENRARFPLMILDRIRRNVGDDLLIEYRVSGDELVDGGLNIDECIQFLEIIQDRIDLVHISAGSVYHEPSVAYMHPSGFIASGHNVYLARKVKESGRIKIPVVAVGALFDPEKNEEIIAHGDADAIATARGTIADPAMPRKAKSGNREDIIPCIKCFNCLDDNKRYPYFSCSVNPKIGQQQHFPYIIPSIIERPKKVVVIGGGPAGMQASITAAQRGHRVILMEKSDHLGGRLSFSNNVYFKRDLNRFMKYLIRQVHKHGVDVRLDTEADHDTVDAINGDVVIAAIGADPICPSIPGIGNNNVMFASEAYENMENIGQKVVVIGGGLTGSETGVYLGQMGKDVTILEMTGKVAAEASATYAIHLNEMIEKETSTITNAVCKEITPSGVVYADESKNKNTIDADTVIIALGMKAKEEEAYSYWDTALEFRSIGDCVKSQNVKMAVRMGFDIGSQI